MTSKHHTPDGLAKRTAYGLFWLASGAGAQAVLRFFVNLVLARLLTPEDFGLITAALATLALAEVFSSVGVGPALIQIRVIEEKHIATGLSVSLLLGAFFGLLTFLGAELLSQFYRMPPLTPVLRSLALVFPLRGLTVVAECLLRREMRFRNVALAEVSAYGLAYSAGIALACLQFGIWSLVFAALLEAVLKAVIVLRLHPLPMRLRMDVGAAGQLLASGLHFTAAQVFATVALKGDYIVVGRWLGAGALGIYSRAYGLMSMSVTLLGAVLNRVLFASMSTIQADRARLRKAYELGVSLLATVLMPWSVVLCVLSEEVVFLALGAGWTGAVVPLRVLGFGMYFRTGYKLSGTVADSTGAAPQNARLQAVYATLMLLATWLGQHWGVTGVAVGVVGVLLVQFLLLSRLALQILGLGWSQFSRLHVRAGVMSVLVLVTVVPVASFCRHRGFLPVLTLGLCGLAVGSVIALLLRVAPTVVLGSAEIWLVRFADDQFGAKVPTVHRVLQACLRRVSSVSNASESHD